jgi:hypothetical protein
MIATSTMNLISDLDSRDAPAVEREGSFMLALATLVSFLTWIVVFTVAAVPLAAYAVISWAVRPADEERVGVERESYGT